MRTRLRRRSRSGSRRRKDWQSNSLWDEVPGTITPGTSLLASYWIAFPADTFGDQAGVNDQIEQEEDNTIVRLLTTVLMSATLSGTGGQGSTFFGAGIIRWESQLQAVPNPLTLPHPVLDSDADWLWTWQQGFNQLSIPANTVVTRSNLVSPDSLQGARAKRKLTSRQGLLFIAEIDNTFGANDLTSMTYANWTRFLVLLP